MKGKREIEFSYKAVISRMAEYVGENYWSSGPAELVLLVTIFEWADKLDGLAAPTVLWK